MVAIALRSSKPATVAAAKPTAAKPAAPAKVAPFAKGKGAADRVASFASVAPAAYIEGKSRADTIAVLRDALGKTPTDVQIAACRAEYIIGRVAFRIAADKPVTDGIAFARDVVLSYAAPVKDGVKANKLRAGQKGRRTVDQHRAVRAAEEAWSQVKAEVMPDASKAMTQADRNKAKRAPHGKTSQVAKAGAAGTGITHSELVKPDGAPMDRATATSYIASMAATLSLYANKHAGVVPTAYGSAIIAFDKAIKAAAKELEASTNVEA